MEEILMSRNFDFCQRDMGRAGHVALKNACIRKEISFSTAATHGERWDIFCKWAKEINIKKMENVTDAVVKQYGRKLAFDVKSGNLSIATAHNYLSSINSVMSIALKGRWCSISPTHDCDIENRSAIRTDAPGALNRVVFDATVQSVIHQLGPRAASIIELARNFGLRSKEASLLNARTALTQAECSGAIQILDGTKGGLKRTVPVSSQIQIETITRAAYAQGDAHAVMTEFCNWKKWREGALRSTRDIVRSMTGGGLHDLRSAYACERYQSFTGQPAPCAGGAILDKEMDRVARLRIAAELGHARIEIVNEYIGGIK